MQSSKIRMQSPKASPNNDTRSYQSQSLTSLASFSTAVTSSMSSSSVSSSQSSAANPAMACSLQDVLEFNSNEAVVTAFEKRRQMLMMAEQQLRGLEPDRKVPSLEQNQQEAYNRRGRTCGGRKQFGRVSSMTFGSQLPNNQQKSFNDANDAATSLRWDRNHSMQRSASLFDEADKSSCSGLLGRNNMESLIEPESEYNIYDDDEGTSDWPVPTDLLGRSSEREFGSLRCIDDASHDISVHSSSNGSTGNGSWRRMSARRVGSPCETIPDEASFLRRTERKNMTEKIVCNYTKGPSKRIETDDPNEAPPPPMPTRNKLIQRCETLPIVRSECEPASFRNSRRRITQRSMSILGSMSQPSSSMTWGNSSSKVVECRDFSNFDSTSTEQWLLENTNPNRFNIISNLDKNGFEDEGESSMQDENARNRKKFRARRHSIQGDLHIAPLRETKILSKFMTSDPTLNWLMPKNADTSSPSSNEEIFAQNKSIFDDYETLDAGNSVSTTSLILGMQSSPSSRSIASLSTRKRTVYGGTPPSLSDNDDFGYMPTSLQSTSSLSSRRTRSVSRIFSPQPDSQFPTLPPICGTASQSLYTAKLDDLACNVVKVRTESDHRSCNKPDAMEDSDEEDENGNSSPNVSMDSISDGNLVHRETSTTDEVKCTVENVFENMSSYDDLKYIIRIMRKESTGSVPSALFGRRATWNVTPSVAWSSQRRNSFLQWACSCLGFTVRSAGMAVLFLQISEDKGTKVLQILETALAKHKLNEQDGKRHEAAVNAGTQAAKLAAFGLPFFDPVDKFHDDTMLANATRDNSIRMMNLSIPSPMQSVIKSKRQSSDDSAFVIESRMSSLTMTDRIPTPRLSCESNATSTLSRIVTIDPNVCEDGEYGKQPCLGRMSMESSSCVENCNDFMFHLQQGATSPRHRTCNYIDSIYGQSSMSSRPPRLSMDSIHTSKSGGNHLNTPFTIFHNQETLATPLMNDTLHWGSHPIMGRDWGTSNQCEQLILVALLQRAEEFSCLDERRDSIDSAAVSCSQLMPRRSSNTLHFDFEETSCSDEVCSIKSQTEHEAEREVSPEDQKRLLRKRFNDFSKKRRISLWASATQNIHSFVQNRKSLFCANRACQVKPILEDKYKSLTCLSNSLVAFNDLPKRNLIDVEEITNPSNAVATDDKIVLHIFSFFTENDLLTIASTVCVAWSDLAAIAHANLMLASVCPDDDDEDQGTQQRLALHQSVSSSMERSWATIHSTFPWACFLAEGGAKRVYKVYNENVAAEEAVSVMDTFSIASKQIVANELAVSALVSSLCRRGICPNFVAMRGMFTSDYGPPGSHWGSAANKQPKGSRWSASKKSRPPPKPKNLPETGRYQYIRMEFIKEGDAEEMIKRQPNEVLDVEVARAVLFQVAFALHAAADKFSMKHYDIKLLNIFLQRIDSTGCDVTLRYGFGSHMFALRMPSDNAFIAKLADFGTANISSESNGQPVTIAQFTTLENTPPDFLILGNEAKQGHGHDNFGLGLSMLHLFTGTAPYEEILEEVKCPPNLKKRLRQIWENANNAGFTILYSIIHDGVVKDSAGNIVEGEPDETLYHTLYRYLVLFGIPLVKFQENKCPQVWRAIKDSLESPVPHKKAADRCNRRNTSSDVTQYKRDCKRFSMRTGTNRSIARARTALESMHGGMDLLLQLCSFDPSKRATAMDVLNSPLMANLREIEQFSSFGNSVCGSETSKPTKMYHYTAFSTQKQQEPKKQYWRGG